MEIQKSPSEEVLFTPFPKQLEFQKAVLSGQYRICGYGGAMGGGKTFVVLATLLVLHKVYPNTVSVVIRDSLPTLKKTTIPSLHKLLPSNFLAKYNQQDQTYYFTNGSKMIFMAEDYAHDKDLDKFKGLEVNFTFLEQLEELQKDTFDMMMIRTGRNKLPSNPPSLIFYTINPSQTWVKDEIYAKAMDDDLPGNHFYLKATILDNPILAEDEEYMETLNNLDDITYQRYINGDWNAFPKDDLFAYTFEDHKHIASGLFYDKGEIYLSFDFNVNPITCIAVQHNSKEIRVIKEWRLKDSDIYQLCSQIKAEIGDRLLIVTGDASGANRSAMTKGRINYYTIIKNELGLAGSQIKAPASNPSIENSYLLTNSMLSRFPSIKIDRDKCRWLIDDLKNVEIVRKGDSIDIDKKDTERSHLLDCFRYYLFTHWNKFIKYG